MRKIACTRLLRTSLYSTAVSIYMYNITLISTNHSERGKCNSDELFKIIEALRPEVIFEEMPNNLHSIVYNKSFPALPEDAPLELKCVKKYLQKYYIKNIPVDIDVSPMQSTDKAFMLRTFENDENHKKFQTEYNTLKSIEGFGFFNSDKFINFSERQSLIEKKIIESSSTKTILNNAYKSFLRENDYRENAMLENINSYCKENRFGQAVFLLGCGHRKAMMEKISEYEELSEIRLNWNIYYGN